MHQYGVIDFRMFLNSSLRNFFLWIIWYGISASAFSLPRTKEYRSSGGEVAMSTKNGVVSEPSCEQLKAMWRYSKRQSRAAELTNEIPMYRDPFTNNIWETYYPSTRSIAGLRMGAYRRPVYGRLIHKPAPLRIQDANEKNKAFKEVTKLYGTLQRQDEPRRRLTTFRLPGGGHFTPLGFPPQTGSFQHLKELIKTERARELQAQRMAEEIAAQNAAIKESSYVGSYRSDPELNYNYNINEDLEDQNSYINGRSGLLVFPNLLAPAATQHERLRSEDERNIDVYSSYSSDGARNTRPHSSTLFDKSSFNNIYG